MRLTCCANCGTLVPLKKTSIVDNKRICHECKRKAKRESRKSMNDFQSN